MEQDAIQKMIDESIEKSMAFSQRKLGDTPTDALQLVNKKYVDGKSYVGAVVNNSAGTLFPTSWVCSANTTGSYTITHNLNTVAYAVLIEPINLLAKNDNVAHTVSTIGANSFTVTFVQSNSPTTDINTDFNFLLHF